MLLYIQSSAFRTTSPQPRSHHSGVSNSMTAVHGHSLSLLPMSPLLSLSYFLNLAYIDFKCDLFICNLASVSSVFLSTWGTTFPIA